MVFRPIYYDFDYRFPLAKMLLLYKRFVFFSEFVIPVRYLNRVEIRDSYRCYRHGSTTSMKILSKMIFISFKLQKIGFENYF